MDALEGVFGHGCEATVRCSSASRRANGGSVQGVSRDVEDGSSHETATVIGTCGEVAPSLLHPSTKLKESELLFIDFSGIRLRMELDRVPLWHGDQVSVKQLIEDFAQYLYLPGMKEPDVLLKAIRDGFARLTWQMETST